MKTQKMWYARQFDQVVYNSIPIQCICIFIFKLNHLIFETFYFNLHQIFVCNTRIYWIIKRGFNIAVFAHLCQNILYSNFIRNARIALAATYQIKSFDGMESTVESMSNFCLYSQLWSYFNWRSQSKVHCERFYWHFWQRFMTQRVFQV